MKRPRIAFLVMAHDNLEQLEALAESLDYKDFDLFIHLDKRCSGEFTTKNTRVSVFRFQYVNWSGFSFTLALLELMRKAMQKNYYEYFVLISGKDYPIRSNRYIYNFFSRNSGKEFISIRNMPTTDKPMYRFNKIYLEFNKNNKYFAPIFNIINPCLRKLPFERKIEDKYRKLDLYGGSTWWALTNRATRYILNYLDANPSFLKYFKYSMTPEEMMFHIILGNSKFKASVSTSLTCADWSKGGEHPSIISYEFVKNLRINMNNNGFAKHWLFARKFSGDKSIIKYVNKYLRN